MGSDTATTFAAVLDAKKLEDMTRMLNEQQENVLRAIVQAGYTPACFVEEMGYPGGTEKHPRKVEDADGNSLALLWMSWDLDKLHVTMHVSYAKHVVRSWWEAYLDAI